MNDRYDGLTEPQRHVLRLMREPVPEDGDGAAAVAALRKALGAARPPGLAALAADVRRAGRLDEDLALELLERARPARTVAALLGTDAGGVAGRVAARLAELTEQHFKGDPRRWRGVHDALASYRGTLPELLGSLSEPAAGPAQLPPRSVPATMALLLEHTSVPEAAAALEVLPDTTVDVLLSTGALPGPVLCRAVAGHGDRRSRTALARHPRLDARILKQLLEAADPVIGAAVYRNPRCTQSLRRALAHRIGTVPMDDGLRRELLSPTAQVPLTWLTPLLGCGDPELVAKALQCGMRRVAQRYALVRVWECRGPDAVRALLADRSLVPGLDHGIRAEAESALGRPDGIRQLRGSDLPYDDPGALARLLSVTRGTSTLRALLNEPYVQDVRALAAAHRQAPFMPKAAEELVRHEDATDTERDAFRLSVLNGPWKTNGRYNGNTTPPAGRLSGETLDDGAEAWAEGMVRAGLLDPVDLLRLAHPAARAVAALARLAECGLLTAGTRTALHRLAAEHAVERPAAWAALKRLLPKYTGTLPELVAEAGRATDRAPAPEEGPAAAVTVPRAEAASASRPTPPDVPRGNRQRAALGALDLLLSLAPEGTALPDDADALRYLAAHGQADSPGLETPAWLREAARAHGVEPTGGWCTAPTAAQATAGPVTSHGTGVQGIETAYTQGVVQTEDLLRVLPAHRLLSFPHDWRRMAFAAAWRQALVALLERDLGTDADAWLRLAATAEEEAGEGDTGPGWPELIDRSRTRPGAGAAIRPDAAPSGRSDTSDRSAVPATADAALRRLRSGDHLWAWAPGTLLCLAGPEVIATVLPRLGPDAPWLLAAYLFRHDRPPQHVFDHLIALRDPEALRVLASHAHRLGDGLQERLADLCDPAVDLALLDDSRSRHVKLRVIRRTRTVPARLIAELRADPSARLPGGRLWLNSAVPEAIEIILERDAKDLGLAEQLTGCLNLVRYGGPERLAAVVGGGRLGQAAARLCQKALATDDPAAVIQSRCDLELSTAKLVKRLRRCEGMWHTDSVIANHPAEPDWAGLEAEHLREPIPQWERLVNRPEAPQDLKLRHSEQLAEPASGRTHGPEATRARARYGLGGVYHEPLTLQVDRLLAAGRLSGRDLAHLAAPAALILSYLNAARRRGDAPAEARAAVDEIAALIRDRLGADPVAWGRVTARLAERDADWDPGSAVIHLLEP